MKESNNPSIKNIALPGQYEPYFRSHIGAVFYVTFSIPILISICLYLAKSENLITLSYTALYFVIAFLIIGGLFLADRVQFSFGNHGALILYPSSVPSQANLMTGESTDGKTGSLKGSGIHFTYSLWIYDDEVISKDNRYLLTRNHYSEKDLFKLDKDGNKIPVKGRIQYKSKQPSIKLNQHNHVIYSIQDSESSDKDALKVFHSKYPIPKKEWTNIQIVQSQQDVSIYLNNKLDSVHTFAPYQNPDMISKGEIVLFPVIDNSNVFQGSISRVFLFNRVVNNTTLSNIYSIGPVQGSVFFELMKSLIDIPFTLLGAMFVS